MEQMKKSKMSKIIGGTTTTVYEVVGFADSGDSVTENEWPKGHIGEGEPIVIEIPL